MGVKTVYNVALQSTEPKEFDEEYPDYDTIISVDYVPYGYTPETFEELGISFDEDTDLSCIMNMIDSRFNHIAEKLSLEKSIDKLAQLKRDFAFQFLFRALVCEDWDFCSNNVAMLFGEDGDFYLGPSFDMELLFDGTKSAVYYKLTAKKTFDFMLETMPDILNDFMSGFGNAVHSGKLEKVIRNTLKVPDYVYEPITNKLVYNYNRMSQIIVNCTRDREIMEI